MAKRRDLTLITSFCLLSILIMNTIRETLTHMKQSSSFSVSNVLSEVILCSTRENRGQ